MRKIYLYNTLSRQKQEFISIEPGKVKMYNCGPTVYDNQHIGNMYSSIFADILRRMFEYLGYDVKQVMNITDVGHLSGDNEGDADTGEDRLEKGAKKFGKTVWEVAEHFTNQFLTEVQKLNVEEPFARPKATNFIEQMIELNKVLLKKGYAYETDEALYFDVTKFPDYTNLSRQKLEEKKEGVREEIYVDPKKKNPGDFVLWFKRVGRFADHSMHWNSSWGDGFPGWHVECSAMSKYFLGDTIDVHTGGIEHISIHHTNEIAQSEAANGKKFVNYWLHHQLILVDGKKMSKSLGNVFLISELEEKGYEALAFRLLILQSKYREQLNFTLESLEAAQNSLKGIRKQIRDFMSEIDKVELEEIKRKPQKIENSYQNEFEEAIADDLNTAIALSVFFKLLKDNNVEPKAKLEQLLSFDKVFGLKLNEIKPFVETPELKELKAKWQEARERKDWETADTLRAEIYKLENE